MNQNDLQQQKQKMNENLKNIKNKILVLSGKGGVGKSTVSASLALQLSNQGYKTGLIDIDLHGPSIPTMLGFKDTNIEMMDDKTLLPIKLNSNLFAVSIENFLQEKDNPLIWRGPMKIGVIRQFLGDVMWPNLDYLIIDSPPGTGDEPLTIAQDIEGIKSIVVTTPQEVALSDVRKSIEFCNKLKMEIIGIIENMGYMICPHCNKRIDILKGNGAETLKEKYNVPLLAKIPLYNDIIHYFDNGELYKLFSEDSENLYFKQIISDIVGNIVKNYK